MSETYQTNILRVSMYIFIQQMETLKSVTNPPDPAASITKLRKLAFKAKAETGGHPYCDEVLREIDLIELRLQGFAV